MKPITSVDPQARSENILSNNLASLRELFPEAYTEGRIDFEVLKQLLGGVVDEREEKYGLNWHGKRRARQLALTPSTGTLRPCPDESVDWNTTRNLMIEGDNLEVLKLLQKSYASKVKLIYIDPPYNTGKDFVYPDDFRDNIGNYLKLTGQIDSDGRKIFSNPESSGRFHTDWLNMMYPRLKLARNLLRDDGVFFSSCDDNEIANLLRCADEIFGEENRIAVIAHKARASVSNDKIISSNHNFIILYARSQEKIFEHRDQFGLEPNLSGFDKVDDRGQYKYVPVDGPGGGSKGNPYYTFLGVTGYFRFSQERMQRMYDEGRIEKLGNGLQQKYYLDEARKTRKTDTTWWDDNLYTSTASTRLKALMGADCFDNPKPVELIQRMLQLWIRDADDLVLDFFAGSGTTGHAVMEQNAADGIPRHFILVQLPESLDPENKDQNSAATYCDQLGKPRNIAELTKERLRRAGKKIKAENPRFAGDMGFRVYKLDSSNIRTWESDKTNLPKTLAEATDHIKLDRSEIDILYELILKFGLDLCVPIIEKELGGMKVAAIGGGALMVCLDREINLDDIELLALGIIQWRHELNPAGQTQVIFRDSAFENDVAKTNITAILLLHGISNVCSL